ncbi:uncharacterized protein LOC113561194 [Rhopalosiphum maidis]|uniref:uncharacterized protein LOC113560516 n=1 Tax=Rhopalosiphum maidis TaxID=43146 RepID=UPI000F010600|nr:uncharacterized protein LOC113560516 [Rhopalosiphum maidis]XP_026823280.1 uncharacterized protein LOC113561194 [Rhopalosiphum maidis]
MKIILLLILSIYFYSPLVSTQDESNADPVICNIAGQMWNSSYIFNINELPGRCDIFIVGQFAFDRDDCTYVMEADENIIQSLSEANKIVFLSIGFIDEDDWGTIFDPPDIDLYNTQKFNPLVDFLNKYKIGGLIINCRDIYVKIENLAQKIGDFAASIKKEIDGLIVGLIITGLNYEMFPNNTLFDFTFTNDILDTYFIDFSFLNECNENSKKTGTSPITSETMTSIEQVTCAVMSSSMDKSKIYALIQVTVTIPKSLVAEFDKEITTYSIYCGSNDLANSHQLCVNPSKLSYDQGAYAKQFYIGIFLDSLDADDYECSCGCGKFPVSNTIIDGWKSCTFTECSKIDEC